MEKIRGQEMPPKKGGEGDRMSLEQMLKPHRELLFTSEIIIYIEDRMSLKQLLQQRHGEGTDPSEIFIYIGNYYLPDEP
jgi:hypothetical protein